MIDLNGVVGALLETVGLSHTDDSELSEDIDDSGAAPVFGVLKPASNGLPAHELEEALVEDSEVRSDVVSISASSSISPSVGTSLAPASGMLVSSSSLSSESSSCSCKIAYTPLRVLRSFILRDFFSLFSSGSPDPESAVSSPESELESDSEWEWTSPSE